MDIEAKVKRFRVDTRDREETFPWAREVESRSLELEDKLRALI